MSVSNVSTILLPQKTHINKRESVPSSTSNAPNLERAAKIDQEAKRLQEEAQENLDYLQDQYEKEYDSQVNHNENLIENQRTQGYKQFRELQRSQQAELKRIQNQGESEVSKLKEYFQNSKFEIENQGKEELNHLQKVTTQKLDDQKQKAESDLAELKTQYSEHFRQNKSDSEKQLEVLNENHAQEYEKLKSNSELAQSQSRTHFAEQYQNTLKQQRAAMENLETKANEQIQELRKRNTSLLSTYQSKEIDPFYKSLQTNLDFYETDHHFILRATIPEYEQEHLSVVIRGNQLILSGSRRNQETIDLDEGQTRTTSSYQTYSQSFPLSWPVDSKKLSRESVGNEVIIRVPKMNQFVYQKPTKEPNPRIPL